VREIDHRAGRPLFHHQVGIVQLAGGRIGGAWPSNALTLVVGWL